MQPPLPTAGSNCLFLDLDETLITASALTRTEEQRRRLAELLNMLQSHFGGAMALVSGRTILDLDQMVAPAHLAAIGLHGLERRYDHIAEIDRQMTNPLMDTLRGRIVASGMLTQGVWMEDRGVALAVHYGSAPETERAILAVLEEALIDLADIHLVRGKMIVEDKTRAFNKAAAVKHFMESALFRSRTPIFVGDSISAEASFHTVQELGGFGVRVGAGDSCANYRLVDGAAVHRWLNDFLEASPNNT